MATPHTSFDPSFSTIVTWFLKFSVFPKGMNHITTSMEPYFVHHNNGGFALILLIGQVYSKVGTL